jgi:hypothetical protein
MGDEVSWLPGLSIPLVSSSPAVFATHLRFSPLLHPPLLRPSCRYGFGELHVPQSTVRSPFQKLDAGDQKGIEPAAHIHFCGCKTVSPVPSLCSGRLLNGHCRICSSSKYASRMRRDAAVRPARTWPAYLSSPSRLNPPHYGLECSHRSRTPGPG